MNTATLATSLTRNSFLRRVLMIDAGTCIATGGLLALVANSLAPVLGLPAVLLEYAGISLFPIAAFMLWVATRSPIPATGGWLIVIGNLAWVVGSAVVLFASSPTLLGYAFVIAQAVVVAALAELEFQGLRRPRGI